MNCAVLTGHNVDNIKAVILKFFCGFHNTAVFNGRHNNPLSSAFFSLGNTENCKVIRLCTAACKIDFVGSCTKLSCNLFSSLYKLLLCIHSTQMERRRIAVIFGHYLKRFFCRLLRHLRSCAVIEIMLHYFTLISFYIAVHINKYTTTVKKNKVIIQT